MKNYEWDIQFQVLYFVSCQIKTGNFVWEVIMMIQSHAYLMENLTFCEYFFGIIYDEFLNI